MTRIHSLLLLSLVAGVCAGAPNRIQAQPSPEAGAEDADSQTSLTERWYSAYDEIARSFRIRLQADADREIQLLQQPLLSYTNPVRAYQQHGRVYLWTDAGRPVVVGSIWSTIRPQETEFRRIAYELHSLSTRALVSQCRQIRWTPPESSIEWMTVEDVRSPGPARGLRLGQMRAIARELRVAIRSDESELRLQDQPLYRYPADVEGALDGALFAYVMGTDPELFVLLEAVEEDGIRRWQMSFARFTHRPVDVTRDGQLLWSCGDADSHNPTSNFLLWMGAEKRPADAPESEPVGGP